MKTSGRIRADRLLVERGLASSRGEAQTLIRSGAVHSPGKLIEKVSEALPADTELTVSARPRFVSRGGDKLASALDDFGLAVRGLVCVDVGASTGGFTDCLLSRGAKKVYAIDVGHDQLSPRLRTDPRVVSREGVNARHLAAEDFADPIDLVVVDAAFIGLDKLLPAIARVLPPGGRLVALVKPQFEVGPELARRHRGVIRDPRLRASAIERVRLAVIASGFTSLRGVDSALPGEKGNVEHFVFGVRTGASTPPVPARSTDDNNSCNGTETR